MTYSILNANFLKVISILQCDTYIQAHCHFFLPCYPPDSALVSDIISCCLTHSSSILFHVSVLNLTVLQWRWWQQIPAKRQDLCIPTYKVDYIFIVIGHIPYILIVIGHISYILIVIGHISWWKIASCSFFWTNVLFIIKHISCFWINLRHCVGCKVSQQLFRWDVCCDASEDVTASIFRMTEFGYPPELWTIFSHPKDGGSTLLRNIQTSLYWLYINYQLDAQIIIYS